ncbi:MAG: suppressor of fused domain protein [Proteobacteria bacterium]|nr:suppressor of fused domain protein [Pseudomonadota bacterium]
MSEPPELPDVARKIVGHARGCFPGREVEALRWQGGGLVENIAGLRIVRVSGGAGGGPWTYISAGASTEAMEDGYGIEVFAVAPGERSEAAKLVSMVAHLHADPRYPLSLGQVLEIGHPWLPGASCDHLLVCVPGPFGDDFEWYSDGDATIRFVWLLPITRPEAELAQREGFQLLQEKLGAAQADVTRLDRASVV